VPTAATIAVAIVVAITATAVAATTVASASTIVVAVAPTIAVSPATVPATASTAHAAVVFQAIFDDALRLSAIMSVGTKDQQLIIHTRAQCG
jgi:hypothetical protein